MLAEHVELGPGQPPVVQRDLVEHDVGRGVVEGPDAEAPGQVVAGQAGGVPAFPGHHPAVEQEPDRDLVPRDDDVIRLAGPDHAALGVEIDAPPAALPVAPERAVAEQPERHLVVRRARPRPVLAEEAVLAGDRRLARLEVEAEGAAGEGEGRIVPDHAVALAAEVEGPVVARLPRRAQARDRHRRRAGEGPAVAVAARIGEAVRVVEAPIRDQPLDPGHRRGVGVALPGLPAGRAVVRATLPAGGDDQVHGDVEAERPVDVPEVGAGAAEGDERRGRGVAGVLVEDHRPAVPEAAAGLADRDPLGRDRRPLACDRHGDVGERRPARGVVRAPDLVGAHVGDERVRRPVRGIAGGRDHDPEGVAVEIDHVRAVELPFEPAVVGRPFHGSALA